jgi:hypothetical protein
MENQAATSNGATPAPVKVSRKQAAANADGLQRAAGLPPPSPEHEALSARWVAGEIDNEEFERLGLEQVAGFGVGFQRSDQHREDGAE